MVGRRDVLKAAVAGAAGAAGLALADGASAAGDDPAPARLKKSLKFSMVNLPGGSILDKFKLIKECGFEGVEVDSPGAPDIEQANAAQKETGVAIHGVIDSVHWNQRLSDPKEEVRARGLAALQQALRDAKALGAGTVLLVPGRVNKDPKADEGFQQCWDRSTVEVKKAIPLAEELGIPICIETVWNDFITRPEQLVEYVDQFRNPIVGAYFDISNMIKYGVPPATWIRTLGKRLYKVDCKGYSLARAREAKDEWKGFCEIGQGDEDWPEVRKALAEVGYTQRVGYVSAEVGGGGKERLTTISRQLDQALGLA